MAVPERISAEEVYKRVSSANAILVCAYESDEKYKTYRLAGSIPFSKFKDLIPTLPRSREIIFYCA